MVSVLVSELSSPGSSPDQGHPAVPPSKTLHSHSASLHPGVQIGTSELNAGGRPAMDQHPIQGGAETIPAASCHRHWDKLRPDRPLGS